MYSLVNAPTLVRDLARHPAAGVVALELLRAFALDRPALVALDRAAADDRDAARRREQAIARDRARPRALDVLAAAHDFADAAGLDAYAAAADVLVGTPIGDLAALDRFVRHDVLDVCWSRAADVAVAVLPRALDVVADGVVGAYAAEPALGARWRGWLGTVAVAPAPTPWPSLVEAVRRLPDADAVPPVRADWAVRMHAACWAVHVTGRERVAAVTQLHALRALVDAAGPQPPLRTVATVVAAVQAGVVADVLDAETHAALSEPFLRLLT